MTTTLPVAELQTFSISEEIAVRASIDRTFESLLANMGRLNEGPDGNPIPMVTCAVAEVATHNSIQNEINP